jgi:hypothetical protein
MLHTCRLVYPDGRNGAPQQQGCAGVGDLGASRGGAREYACGWQRGSVVGCIPQAQLHGFEEMRKQRLSRHCIEGERGAVGKKQPRPSLRKVVALGTPQRRCSLRPTPFTRVGVRAHGLITPPQAREPQ